MAGGRADFGKVHGRITHDEADGQDPVEIGGYASAAQTTPVSTDGDVVKGWWSRFGELHVLLANPFAPNATLHGFRTVALVSPADTEILGAPGANKSYRISSIYGSNVNPSISLSWNLRDGSVTIASGRSRLDGGGFVWSFEPRGAYTTANTAFKGNIDVTASAVIMNVLFDVVDTPPV